MRFAEIFLRLGASLVGWMVIIAYLLWLAVARQIDCAASGDEFFRLLLFAGPAAAALSLMALATAPMSEIQAILKWLGVAPALLSPLALLAVWDASATVYLADAPLCGDGSVAAWQLSFPPVALLSMAVMLWVCLRAWKKSSIPT